MTQDSRPEQRFRTSVGVVLLLVLAAAVHAKVGAASAAWLHREFVDPDGYARFLRVLALWAGGGWHDPVLAAVGAPHGVALHWTRPLDVLIILPAVPAMAFMAPEAALYWSAATLCPVLHAGAALAAVWAARALWPADWAWLAGLLVLAGPASLGYSTFGRADHHTLILLLAIVGLGHAMRAATGQAGAAFRAGLAFGAGVWVSPEALLVAVPVLAAFGLRAMADARAAEAGWRMAAGMASVIALALPVERPVAGWLAADQDRVSVQHLVLALAMASVFVVAARWGRVAAIAAAIAAVAALLLAWPDLLRGPAAAAEGDIGQAFLASVAEMQPLRFGSAADLAQALSMAGGAAAAALGLAVPLLARGFATPRWRAAAPVILLPLLGCLAATLHAQRFAVDLAAPAAIAAAGFVPAVAAIADRAGPLVRLPAFVAASFLALLLPYAGAAARPVASGGEACDLRAAGAWLAATMPAGAVLAADDINPGPELAHRSGLRVLAGPYHQLAAAFADTAAIFNAPEEATSLTAARRRDADLLLVCAAAVPLAAPWREDGLRARLLRGEAPGWLAEEALPPAIAATGLRFYRVRR